MSDPLITVLMPVYNGEKYLSQAIESIFNQRFTDYELLIVDDCSTDKSVEIINSYNDERITLIRNHKNCGQSQSLNIGLAKAKGEFIARIDQDDISYENRLMTQFKRMSKNNISVLGSWSHAINATGEIIGDIRHPTTSEKINSSATNGCPMSHSSVLMVKKDIIDVGAYSTDYTIAMDWHLWIKIIRSNGIIENIPEYLVALREHQDQVTKLKNYNVNNQREPHKIILQNRKYINNKNNLIASLAWELHFEISLINSNTQTIKFKWIKILIKYPKLLLPYVLLIFFHKILKRPNLFYDCPTTFKRVKNR